MGIQFIKARPLIAGAGADDAVALRYEAQEEDGSIVTAEHDLVVLSLGLVPGWSPVGHSQVATAADGFIQVPQPKLSPTLTEVEGVFVAGAAAGPKDIVDAIAEAGAAAMAAANYLTEATAGKSSYGS
jgi:heterodisulfide reductase subunit A